MGRNQIIWSVLILSLALLPGTALPLDIVFNFDSPQSDNPAYDPAGEQLGATLQAVESYWESLLGDSHTLTVYYWWENLSDPEGILGSHQCISTSGGRETLATIRFDTQTGGSDRLWYFDPTPEDNSEYDMSQTLYCDLTPSQQANWFNGSPPDLLEVGYRGQAKTSAPNAARNGFDLFSVALHEVGHALGLSSCVASGEVGDVDYDVDSDLVHGVTMAVESYAAGNLYHLAPSNSLMYPYSQAGRRTLPTPADVFSMAAASNWSEIDLPRKDYLGGSFWNTDYNWLGNRVPDSSDAVWVRHGGNVALSATGYAEQLTVQSPNSLLDTGENLLLVGSTTTLGGGGQIVVQTSGALETNELIVEAGGELGLAGGTVTGSQMYNNGLITGLGQITSTDLVNNGTIEANGGTVVLNTSGSPDLDGDLAGSGVIKATAGDVRVEGSFGLIDFAGELSIGAGYEFRMEASSLQNHGLVDLSGGTYVG